jgi:hypothetical protein
MLIEADMDPLQFSKSVEILMFAFVFDHVARPVPMPVVFEPGHPPVRVVGFGLHEVEVVVAVQVQHPRADRQSIPVMFAEVDVHVRRPTQTRAVRVFIPGLCCHYVRIAVAVQIADRTG